MPGMSWLLTILILSFGFSSHLSEARTTTGKKKLPSVLVVGTVYCDTCFRKQFSKTSHFISGASVAVECDAINSKTSFRKEVNTNKIGEFKVHLPFSVGKDVEKIQGCSVKLIRSSHPYCAVASTTTSSSLHIKSRSPRTYIFSAGVFTFKPLSQPKFCNRKTTIWNSKNLNYVKSPNNDPDFPISFQDPQIPLFPPVDDQGQFAPLPKLPSLPPLPQLPPLPSLPNFPYLPPINPAPKGSSEGSDDKISDQKTFGLPPNPFHTPVIFNPFQPPPPIIPPLIPSPPSSIINPPLPRATPLPTPPAFSLIPPFPFQPSRGFPGTPPP